MIESQDSKVVYRVSGERVFPFPYSFYDPEDLQVWLADDEESNNNRRLTIGSDYSVELKEDYQSGSEIILSDAEEFEGKYLTIIRVLPLVQKTSLPNNGKLPSAALEKQLDKLVMILQQLEEKLARCVKMPVQSIIDPSSYLDNVKTITVNAKDVALNAADAAAHSALNASISERNMGLIWAELTGDSSLAENALLTVKEAAEATGAIKTAKEIAIGEINGIGSMAIASTQKAAAEATEAAKAATDSAGAITGKIDDAITIKVSEAVGAEGVLGVAVAAGVRDVEAARQEAMNKASSTLETIRKEGEDFTFKKQQGLSEIDQKVAGIALDVETTIARAQTIADSYLDDARVIASTKIAELEEMKAAAANKPDRLALINKRIADLQLLATNLSDSESAAEAAEEYRNKAEQYRDESESFSFASDQKAQSAAASASAASASASAAAASAAESAASAESAESAASAAETAAENAVAGKIEAHNVDTSAHLNVISAHNVDPGAHNNLLNGLLKEVDYKNHILEFVQNGGYKVGPWCCKFSNGLLIQGGVAYPNLGSGNFHRVDFRVPYVHSPIYHPESGENLANSLFYEKCVSVLMTPQCNEDSKSFQIEARIVKIDSTGFDYVIRHSSTDYMVNVIWVAIGVMK